jgi:hypothetical protein
LHCLYCSKEIGVLKALKGSEYCSAAHRKQHGLRLGKALSQMFAPEPPPAGVAGFFLEVPPCESKIQCALAPWQSGPSPHPIRSIRAWQFSIDSTIDSAITPRDAVCASASPLSEDSIPQQAPALPAPVAEPAASFVQPSLARFVTVAQADSLPDFRIAADLPASRDLHQAHVLPAPAAEPVARFVQPSAALFVQVFVQVARAISLPHFRIAADLSTSSVLHQAPAPFAPAAEPAASFVQPSAAHTLVAVGGSRQAGWPAFWQFAGLRHAPSLASAAALPGLAAEAAASFVQPSLAQPVPAMAPALRMAAFRIAADLEPLPMADDLIESTRICEVFWAVPAAEAASIFVRSSVASAFSTPIALASANAASAIARPHVPVAAQCLAPRRAEPAMEEALPHAADSPIVPVRPAASWYAPHIPGFVHGQSPDIAQAIAQAPPSPDAVESSLPCSMVSVPMPATPRDQIILAVAALALAKPAATLAVASPAMGPLGAGVPEPVAVESLLACASAAPIFQAADVQLLPFQLAASNIQPSATKRIVPSFDGLFLTLNAAEPEPVSAKVNAMQPISTLKVKVAYPQPGAQHSRPLHSIPQPGLLALEYHSQSLRSAAVARVEWRKHRLALFPPRLSLRPVFEKHEQVVWQKPVSKPGFDEVFTMPEARRPGNAILRHAGMAIAASLLAGAVLWLGASAARMGKQMAVARAAAGEASPRNATQPVGTMAWMRGAISDRATLEAADNFRGGMESWGSLPQTYAAGWARHADGYVHPGKLALFNPSLRFKDYRLEFSGLIESKSVGWVVRAQDPKNYYAMKFTVLESGARTVIAVAHYPVVDGKAGHKVETPLNVMVHRNTPFQVAVNVKGNHFVTSVDGEEVDSWSDDRLASGGIGFFSEAGERARIYWMKVSKNDDWLGRVCALFAGGPDTQVAAELWGPGYPGGAPVPSAPAGPDRATLAAAGMGLPYYFRASQKKARVSTYWKRDEPWNS